MRAASRHGKMEEYTEGFMNTNSTKLRPELEELPERIAALPVFRGYPVPWFVDWINGEPEFRAMDAAKWTRAIRERLCWVCGERLGRFLSFVAGPMCGINRTSSEPPNHLECAQWSARNCPFLARPKAVRREDEKIAEATGVGGISIKRNPGVAMVWTTLGYQVFRDGLGGYLVEMGEPLKVEWYAEGKPATYAQVMNSITSGLPYLEDVAKTQDGAMEELEKKTREFVAKYLPVG